MLLQASFLGSNLEHVPQPSSHNSAPSQRPSSSLIAWLKIP